MPLISVVNQSTMVSNADVQLMCKAIQVALDLMFIPAYNLKSGTIKFYDNVNQAPGYSYLIMIVDNSDVEGALGYHQEENTGKIDGYIIVSPILSNGGTSYKYDPANPGQYTVSSTLAHEVFEAIINPYTNYWCDNGNVSWCKEVADPVEQISFPITVNGEQVAISDFVFPSFFNPDATLKLNAPFNYLNTLTAPFTMLSGGYSIQRDADTGTEKQVFGETMPEWRREMKRHKFARMNRRTK